MAFQIIECIGLYVAKKTLSGAYNSTCNILFGSDSYNIDKKLDSIIKQNETLKKEIFEIKNNISNNHKTIIYKNCELKLIDNYINTVPQNNNLSKSMYEKKKIKKCNNLSKSCFLLV